MVVIPRFRTERTSPFVFVIELTDEPPGNVDVSKAVVLAGYDTLIKTKPYAEGILIPAVPRTYRFPVARLPGVITGKADSGTYLGMALLFGIEEALAVFNIDLGRLDTAADTVRCLGDVIEATRLATPPSAEAVAALTKAVLSCVSTAATTAGRQAPGPLKVVIGILTTGVSLVAAGLQGAVRTVTGTDTFTLNLDARVPAVDLHHTKLTSIRVPATLCGTNGDFTLRNGSARAKEEAHWRNALQKWAESGDEQQADAARAKLGEIGDAIRGVEEREANIRTGWVYVISNVGSFGDGVVKVGLTRRLDPLERVRELGDASVPFRFDVHAKIFDADAVSLETRLHQRLADRRVNRVNLRREFFYANPSEILTILEDMGLKDNLVDYVEDAEAQEWRSSQRLAFDAGDQAVSATVS
jgi:hypothetical protein